MEIRAVVRTAEGVEDIRVNAVLNIVDRAITEDGIDSGRMGGAKDPKAPQAATPKPGLSTAIIAPGVPGRPLHVLIPRGVGKNRTVDPLSRCVGRAHGRIIPVTRVPDVIMLGLDRSEE